MNKFKSGQIMTSEKKEIHCCKHKNLVPLEIGFARKTYPNGYSADPYYNFAVNMVSADVIRIRSYLCLDCGCEVKAPEPGQCKKDIL